jgi:ComF family protein
VALPLDFDPGLSEDPEAGFCYICRNGLFLIDTPTCGICGHPLCDLNTPQHICYKCQHTPPLFNRAYGIYAYAGAIRDALHHFKFNQLGASGRCLTQMFARRANELSLTWPEYDWATCVPLHDKRLRYRGFNQAWKLLEALPHIPKSRKTNGLLMRIRDTKPQFSLSPQQRERNLMEAFSIKTSWCRSLAGTRILLVDDLLTTGTTANYCCKVLKEAGAKSIDILTLCRAIM